jgi:hypothetical protein
MAGPAPAGGVERKTLVKPDDPRIAHHVPGENGRHLQFIDRTYGLMR